MIIDCNNEAEARPEDALLPGLHWLSDVFFIGGRGACICISVYVCIDMLYIYIYIYIERERERDRCICIYMCISHIFCPGGVGASHEQMCGFGIVERWYWRVPQQTHHDLHPLLGWKGNHTNYYY